MSITFGWWNRDPVEGKLQIHVEVHGGNIEWSRHQGHNTSWEPYQPTEEDRERLVYEAQKRVPRRLISQKQFDEIKRLSQNDVPGKISGKRVTGLGPPSTSSVVPNSGHCEERSDAAILPRA